MQVETSYTFKNYLYIVISGFFSQNKVEKICPEFVDLSNIALVGHEMIIANSVLRASLAIYHLISNMAHGIIVNYTHCAQVKQVFKANIPM